MLPIAHTRIVARVTLIFHEWMSLLRFIVVPRGYAARNYILTVSTSSKERALLFTRCAPSAATLLLAPSAPPCQAPVKNAVNEPKNVAVSAEWIAQLKNVSIQAVVQATSANARRLFPNAFSG